MKSTNYDALHCVFGVLESFRQEGVHGLGSMMFALGDALPTP